MKALILAAGEGTRLRPLTANQPKPTLLVGGTPLLEQIVSRLQRQGITDIAINLHYKPWAIVQHLGYGRRWGVQIHYSFEENLLGTAGAAKRLEWYFDETFIVVCGDVYTEMSLSGLMAAHEQNGARITVAVHQVDGPAACGVVELDRTSRVRRFEEVPATDHGPSRLAYAGIFVAEPEILSGLPADRHLGFEQDVFPQMLEADQPISGYLVTDPVIDIDTPDNYEQAQRLAAERMATETPTDLASRIAAPTIRNLLQGLSAASAE